MRKTDDYPEKILDPQIREALFTYLEAETVKIRVMDEFNLGDSRADFLAVTDGILTGYEIKSDSDSYTRLKTQTRDYSRYCDYCYAVVGKSHQSGIVARVPDFWGVIIVEDEGGIILRRLREAKLSPEVTFQNKLDLLWKNELANIRKKYGMPKYEGRSKGYMIRSLNYIVSEARDTLPRYITDELFERDYTKYPVIRNA
jgi:hypothetical protein